LLEKNFLLRIKGSALLQVQGKIKKTKTRYRERLIPLNIVARLVLLQLVPPLIAERGTILFLFFFNQNSIKLVSFSNIDFRMRLNLSLTARLAM
jgi:hypothetical protein